MERVKYIPERGDLVQLNFDPVFGHEQGGFRPALVLSPKKYNAKTRRAIVCPITSKIHNYSLEVKFDTPKVRGVIYPDQVRSIDWYARNARYLSKISQETLDMVCYKLELLIKTDNLLF